VPRQVVGRGGQIGALAVDAVPRCASMAVSDAGGSGGVGASTAPEAPPAGSPAPVDAEAPRFPTAMWAAIAVAISSPTLLSDLFSAALVENWATVFLSVTLQALPFLVLGVVVSAAISSLVPSTWLARALPRRTELAVPVAGLAGAVLPGCECSSVPVAGRLVERGVPQAAALTFLLAAPAINPVVIVATAVAFPGHPEVVVARFVASLATATAVGIVWARVASADWMESRLAHVQHSHGRAFVDTVVSDFLQAGGFLVLGAGLVATLQTVLPRTALDGVAGGGLVSVVALAGLAIVLSICSEADAFVAAGLTQFSLTARLAFLVVGPMIDLKLIAMHVGAFGRRFALRFDPLTVAIAVVVSVAVGHVLL
jgi:uncharacterized membrane protein YraQ (UPF0718 family)